MRDFIKIYMELCLNENLTNQIYDYYLDKLRSVKFHRIEIISEYIFQKNLELRV